MGRALMLRMLMFPMFIFSFLWAAGRASWSPLRLSVTLHIQKSFFLYILFFLFMFSLKPPKQWQQPDWTAWGEDSLRPNRFPKVVLSYGAREHAVTYIVRCEALYWSNRIFCHACFGTFFQSPRPLGRLVFFAVRVAGKTKFSGFLTFITMHFHEIFMGDGHCWFLKWGWWHCGAVAGQNRTLGHCHRWSVPGPTQNLQQPGGSGTVSPSVRVSSCHFTLNLVPCMCGKSSQSERTEAGITKRQIICRPCWGPNYKMCHSTAFSARVVILIV